MRRPPIRSPRIAVVALVVAAAILLVWPAASWLRSEHETAVAQTHLRAEARALRPRHPPGTEVPLLPVAAAAPLGHALATLVIPRFGADWSWVVVEGTDAAQLSSGPGHYPGTALPGQRGNVAVAGHRAGHGDPFIDFDLLRRGDEVEFTQGRTTWVYRLTMAPVIIPPTADWVLDPLPGYRLTLTTCWPKYGSSMRMYVRGTLTTTLTSPGRGPKAGA